MISNHFLFNESKQWCPICLEEMAEEDACYEPLLWSFQVINTCLKHKRILDKTCYYCGKSLKQLNATFPPGYCDHCGEWLGKRKTEFKDQESINMESLKWQEWVSISIGSLLEINDREIYRDLNSNEVLTSLKERYQHVSNNRYSLIGLSAKKLLTLITLEERPCLEAWLKISFSTGVSLSELFLKKSFTSSIATPNYVSNSFIAKKVNPEKIEIFLNEILDNNLFISLKDIERKTETSMITIKRYFPNLIEKIKERNDRRILEENNKKQEAIESSILQLQKEGTYPSQWEVEKAIQKRLTKNQEQYRKQILEKVGIPLHMPL